MGMTKLQTSLFLAIFFATLVICAVVICTCAYCYKPSFFPGIRRNRSSSDYTISSSSSGSGSSGSDDTEKAPRGRVVGRSTVTAARHPSDHSDYDLEAVEVEVVDAIPGDEHGHHHHHHHHGHAEPIDIIDADLTH